jgi:hypothetical protein
MQLLLGPVLAIIDPGYYARMARESLGRAMLYVLYLSAVTAVVFGLTLERWWLPECDDFVAWAAARLPAITFTKDGVVSPAPQPFELVHPAYGMLLRLDTGRDVPELDHDPPFLTITRTRMALAQQRGEGEAPEYRILDVVPHGDADRASWTDRTFDGATAAQIYATVRPWLHGLILVAVGATFVWKMLAGLLYSLFALVANAVLRARLPYPTLLTLTLFALTPTMVLEWLAWSGVIPWPAGGAGSLVTVLYVFLAVRSAAMPPPPAIA